MVIVYNHNAYLFDLIQQTQRLTRCTIEKNTIGLLKQSKNIFDYACCITAFCWGL